MYTFAPQLDQAKTVNNCAMHLDDVLSRTAFFPIAVATQPQSRKTRSFLILIAMITWTYELLAFITRCIFNRARNSVAVVKHETEIFEGMKIGNQIDGKT